MPPDEGRNAPARPARREVPAAELVAPGHAYSVDKVLEALVEGSQDQLVFLDLNFNFVRVNRAYAETCRRAPEEFIGHSHFEFYPHPENQAIFERVRDTGKPAVWREKPFVFPDQPERGTTYWDWTLAPVRDRAGVISGFVFSLRDVTETVLARQRLRESEREASRRAAEMEGVFASIQSPVIMFDADGTVTHANTAARKVLGTNPINLPLDDWTRLVLQTREMRDGDSRPMSREALPVSRALRGEPVRAELVSLREAVGRNLVFEISATPVMDGDRIAGVCAVWHDVTDQYLAREALRKSEHELARKAEAALSRLAAMVESSQDAIIVKDLDGVIRSWNAGAERLYGWSASEIVGQPIGILAPSDRARETMDVIDRIRKGERGLTFDTVRIRKDGQRVDVALTISPIKGAGGDIVGASTIARDIGERKRAEEQLRAASLHARSLIEASLDPLVTISPEGKITDVNRATEEVTGVPRDRLVGTDFADCFTEPEIARVGYRQVLSRGSVRDYPLTIRSVDGHTTDVLYNATTYRSPEGTMQGVFAAARDVTERLKVERDRERIAEHLRQSQKLEAVGRLAGGVAHDFNNLLTAIIGASNFLLEGLEESEPLREEAKDILEAAYRASSLTRQLLTFSRKQVIQPRVLDLNEVVASTDRMLRRLIGEDVEFVTRLDPALGHVRADPGQLEQVIVNLAVNARDAMPRGGHIIVETANLDLPDQVGASLPPGRYVRLAVRDDGCGMSAEVQSHLFEPFFTTKPAGRGTGLGLSTVYGIAKQAGGDVRVVSDPGVGSTFELLFPRVEAAAEGDASVDAGPSPGGRETILLVEDEPLVRSLTAKALRMLGYSVKETADGEEAWAVAAGHGNDFDLVVTDVVMPRMGGMELADRLRRERPDIPVLFLSGYAEDSPGFSNLLDGGEVLLQKPFAPNALARRVRDLLDHPDRHGRGPGA